MSAYERLPVDAPPAAVVQALRDVVAARGITEYALVDHGHDMAAAGAEGFPAWTLVFGNPAAGAKVLAQDLAAAVDIPLRMAVIARAGGGSEIVLRNMQTLLEGELSAIAEELTVVLRAIAMAAADRFAKRS
jgi:uncharacterized protein (DUF302 family)